MRAAFQATVEDIDGAFTKAFSSLPEKVKAAFDDNTVRRFRSSVKDISDNFRKLNKSADELADKNKILEDRAKKLQEIIVKQIEAMGKLNREEQETIKALMNKARTVDDLLETEEYGYQLAQKNFQQRQQLYKIYQQTNAAIKAANAGQAAYNVLLAQQYRNQQMSLVTQRLFGANMNKIQNTSNYIHGLWTNTSIWTKIALAVGLIGKQLVDGFIEARRGGNEAVQAFGTTWQGAITAVKGMLHGVFVGVGTSVENRTALQNVFGTLNVPEDINQEANKLTSQYGQSKDQAAALLNILERVNGFQHGITKASVEQFMAYSRMRGVPVNTILKDLSESTVGIALYANRGADAMARMAIEARQTGTTVDKMVDVMGGFVDDFGDSLQRMSTLQTVLPGLNPDRMLYLANFGTPDQFEEEIRRQFANAGIRHVNQIPGGLAMARLTARGLGIPVDQLEQILNPTPNQAKGPGGLLGTNTANTWINAVMDFITHLKGATAAVLVFTAALFAGSIFNGIKGLFSGGLLSKLGGAVPSVTQLFGGGAAAGGAAAGGAAGGLTAGGLLGGLGSAVATAALPAAAALGIRKFGLGDSIKGEPGWLNAVSGALQSNPFTAGAGEMIDNHYIEQYLQQPQSPKVKMTPQIQQFLAKTPATQEEANQQKALRMQLAQDDSGIDLSGIEKKLDDLLHAFKNMGIKVEMDSKKVGYAILDTFSR